jgi:hypothetical protein
MLQRRYTLLPDVKRVLRGRITSAIVPAKGRKGRARRGNAPEVSTMSQNAWPQTPKQQVAWLLERIDDWTTHATAIGLDPTALSAFSAQLTGVQTNLQDAIATRSIAKGKTQTFYSSAEPLSEAASGLLKTIRAYAATSGADNVWELARIDPPALPSPVPAPTTPSDVVTTLTNTGAIHLKWKAKNASPSAGTAFTIHRKIDGQSAYQQIGTVGVREFTDETVPPGAPSVNYMIRGIRGDKVGAFSEPVTVYLGKTPMNGEEGGLSLAA